MFVMDESNVLDSSFLERMNTLLANGEVYKLLIHPHPSTPGEFKFHIHQAISWVI